MLAMSSTMNYYHCYTYVYVDISISYKLQRGCVTYLWPLPQPHLTFEWGSWLLSDFSYLTLQSHHCQKQFLLNYFPLYFPAHCLSSSFLLQISFHPLLVHLIMFSTKWVTQGVLRSFKTECILQNLKCLMYRQNFYCFSSWWVFNVKEKKI